MPSRRFLGSAIVVAAALAIGTNLIAPTPEAVANDAVRTTAATTTPDASRPAVSAPPATPDPTESTPPKVVAVPNPPPPPSVPRGGGKVMYLSFDDGPHGRWTPQVLDLLAKHKAHATFFVIGNQVGGNPGLIDRIRAGGHTIGNHTWSHPDLTKLSTDAVISQLTRTSNVVGATTCTRPPMGMTSDGVVSVLHGQGQRQQLWDIDTRDWRRPGSDKIAKAVLDHARSGAVILMHDGGGDRSQTVAALAKLLPALTKAGWRLEAIPGC